MRGGRGDTSVKFDFLLKTRLIGDDDEGEQIDLLWDSSEGEEEEGKEGEEEE